MKDRMLSGLAVTLALVLAAGWSAPTLAQDKKSTRIVCWKDKNGKVVGCGESVPPEYRDAATRELDGRGVTRATTESAADAAKRKAQEQELAKQKAEEQKRIEEQKRQDTALVNTFTSAKEIDQKRDRDLAQIDNQIDQMKASLKNVTERYNEVKSRSDASIKSKKPVSEPLKDELAKTASDKARLEQSIAAKEKEKEELRQRYAEQKQRYLELKGESPAPTQRVERAR
jgi:chromosome segregation ATPase